MKNAKLNVISMSCGDVIATSCASAYGVAIIVDNLLYLAELNGGEKPSKSLEQKLKNNANGHDSGYYHFDSEGNIYEKCPCTYEEYEDAHNLN